jgi:hypothetical protein
MCDALQQLGVVPQAADIAPGNLVGCDAKMLVAERLDPSEHPVDLSLLVDEGSQRILVRPGACLAGSGDHLGPRRSLSEPMKASSAALSQKKIDPIMLFFDLTLAHAYGWRAIFWPSDPYAESESPCVAENPYPGMSCGCAATPASAA